MGDTIFYSAAALFFFCLCLESWTSFKVIRGSKKDHPALWKHSGEPTLMSNGDLISAWPLVKYYRNREYLAIEDPDGIAFAEKMRGPFINTYYSAAITVIIFLLALLFGKLLS